MIEAARPHQPPPPSVQPTVVVAGPSSSSPRHHPHAHFPSNLPHQHQHKQQQQQPDYSLMSSSPSSSVSPPSLSDPLMRDKGGSILPGPSGIGIGGGGGIGGGTGGGGGGGRGFQFGEMPWTNLFGNRGGIRLGLDARERALWRWVNVEDLDGFLQEVCLPCLFLFFHVMFRQSSR
jgi:hypothetical protein